MIVKSTGEILYPYAEEARSFARRLRGLLGVKKIPHGHALVFPNCRSVHCIGMRTPIDVVYLDPRGVVLAVETVRPWRIGPRIKGAESVLEAAPGSARELGIERGTTLTFEC